MFVCLCVCVLKWSVFGVCKCMWLFYSYPWFVFLGCLIFVCFHASLIVGLFVLLCVVRICVFVCVLCVFVVLCVALVVLVYVCFVVCFCVRGLFMYSMCDCCSCCHLLFLFCAV